MEVEVEEDRISALWDSIILKILMCLPYTQTECAIATLTLSKRWLRFWTDFFNIKYHNPNSSIWPSAFPGFESVAETLIQCRQLNLAKFHLYGNYKILFQSHVNNWIRYAVNCNVKDLDLTFTNTEFVLEEFFFINACFIHLNLSGCIFNPTGAINWKKLKSLCISFAYIDEDMIENILSGCSVLDTFELGYCNGYTVLDITSKSVKNLVITGYGDPEADEYPDIVKINAPHVLSLTIRGCLLVWKILLLNVSSLVKGYLNFNKCENYATIDEEMFGLIISLLHAKELNIGILCNEVFSHLKARGFTFSSNLKILDSQEVADSSYSSDSDGDSVKSGDWKYFYMRERKESSLDGGQITVKLLQDQIKFEDRISALPDGLLIEILSRLPDTKNAIRTGTLSKRWIHLWTYIPTLIFQRGYRNDFLISDFFPSIDKTLTQCRQLKLYKFELCSCRGYDIQFESQVNKWIRYAITCNVEELYLELYSEGLEDEFVLDEFFYTNSCITDLTLKGCIFNPMGAISWEKLKSLYIARGILDEDLIENILLGSPLLETLELKNCSGYMRLDITSKSVKNLIFSGYVDLENQYNGSDIIEINAPNILSLIIRDELLLGKLVLLNVSSLLKADLDYSKDMIYNIEQEQMLKELILNLQHIKELKIGISCFKPFFRLEATGFVFPSNLKVLDSLDGMADWSDWSDLTDSDADSHSDADSIVNGDWRELR